MKSYFMSTMEWSLGPVLEKITTAILLVFQSQRKFLRYPEIYKIKRSKMIFFEIYAFEFFRCISNPRNHSIVENFVPPPAYNAPGEIHFFAPTFSLARGIVIRGTLPLGLVFELPWKISHTFTMQFHNFRRQRKAAL